MTSLVTDHVKASQNGSGVLNGTDTKTEMPGRSSRLEEMGIILHMKPL
jgi:hypothetical protein